MPGEIDMTSALADMSTGLGFELEGGGPEGEELDLEDEGQQDSEQQELQASEEGQEEEDPAKKPEGETTPAGAAKPPIPAPGPNDPPKTWRAEAAAEWAKLPETVKAEIRKREEDAFRGIEGYKEAATYGNSIREVMRPYEAVLAQHNIDPKQQIAGLMNSHYTLAFGAPEAKAELIRTIFRDYKIDPRSVFGGQDSDEPAYIDPAVKALQDELTALKSERARETQTRQQQERAENQRQVEAFFADKEKYPYAEELGNDMALLIERGVCKTLQEAYEKALWGNPSARAKETARVAAAEAEKRKQAENERLAKLKAVTAAKVKTTSRTGSAAAPLGSLEDTLNATYRELASRS